jgi:hypothetical protein
MTNQNFESAFASFVAGCKEIVKANDEKFNNVLKSSIVVEHGRRYVRLVKVDASSRSAYCFVDTKNGDVLKAASWKAPAKGARGNIFNDDNGLTGMGPYGAAYLR